MSSRSIGLSSLASAGLLVAVAFDRTHTVRWQSRASREQWGDLVERKVSSYWPREQMFTRAGEYSVVGPSPTGPVRVEGFNIPIRGGLMLSVVVRTEPLPVGVPSEKSTAHFGAGLSAKTGRRSAPSTEQTRSGFAAGRPAKMGPAMDTRGSAGEGVASMRRLKKGEARGKSGGVDAVRDADELRTGALAGLMQMAGEPARPLVLSSGDLIPEFLEDVRRRTPPPIMRGRYGLTFEQLAGAYIRTLMQPDQP